MRATALRRLRAGAGAAQVEGHRPQSPACDAGDGRDAGRARTWSKMRAGDRRGGRGAEAGLLHHHGDRVPRVVGRAEGDEQGGVLLARHLGGAGLAGDRERSSGKPAKAAAAVPRPVGHHPLEAGEHRVADVGRDRLVLRSTRGSICAHRSVAVHVEDRRRPAWGAYTVPPLAKVA